VREEFNRADALQNDKRAGTVGFALTILQRRLASSPEAIYQSLRRRRERLESRLRELELLQRGGQTARRLATASPGLDAEDLEDLEEAPDNEVEAIEEEVLDQATAARTIERAEGEIATLKRLEGAGAGVRRSGDRHQVARAGQPAGRDLHPGRGRGNAWRRRADPLRRRPHPAKPKPRPPEAGHLHRAPRHAELPRERIATLLGRKEAVVMIHGGMGREERTEGAGGLPHDPRCRCCWPPTPPARASTCSAPT
jgi:hypothetical protein